MTVATLPSAGGLETSVCEVCGTVDALGLGTCATCAGGRHESLLFFERSGRRADRQALEAWLVDALGGLIDREEARDVADGVRPVVGLPGQLAGRVAGSLSRRGLAASWVPADRAWRKTPPALLALLGSILGAGLFTGITVTPWLLALSVAFAGLLTLAALRRLREPVWAPEAASVFGLPHEVESRVRSTLTRLETARARHYLVDLAALSAALMNPGDGDPGHEIPKAIAELLRLASEAAVDLDNLDVGLTILERQAQEGPVDVEIAEAAAQAATSRALLARRFDESLAALGRLQAVSTDAPDRLVQLAEKLAEDADHRARAWEAVRRLTA
ncbi:MAG: hypothetical protein OEU54_11860 [Gemmatimonadota bacterium]|nr:hypothetical protein [Gemmatimonadota bacterium]